MLSANEIFVLKRVIFNLLLAEPTVGYSRPLLLIAAGLLRVAADEEVAFVLLLAVSTQVLPSFFGNDASTSCYEVHIFQNEARFAACMPGSQGRSMLPTSSNKIRRSFHSTPLEHAPKFDMIAMFCQLQGRNSSQAYLVFQRP